ncbi:cytochrome P450 [Segniliparus rotundus DSM 44985]|uniref:Cytochrome P450 n=1 Tax=Segniliparus rotundus (strain ATCC BAA-972 / CDC 1076 / CIP 108378 / DSM 44985 / JCM 13578) TaxID=640132 RepID=D6Z913_SEGRD|nr:cytochrome P450 [Segniliparus rotundus]ADG98443.1 cytochrome P450 [Segniliparus rotundus DSM 44985]
MGVASGEKIVPGPRWPAAVQTFLAFTRGWEVGSWLRGHYAKTVEVRSYRRGSWVSIPTLLTSDPAMARQVFAGSPKVYHAGASNAILAPVLGKRSLLSIDGEDHARIRKLLMPSFAGAALRGYASMFEELAEADAQQWPTGRVTAALEHTHRLTLDIILRTVFGVSDPQRSAVLRPRVLRVALPGPGTALWAWAPRSARLGVARGYRGNLAALNRILAEEIAARRADSAVHERKDVLSRMVAANEDGDRLCDEELRDQLLTLVMAGFETTAKALAWCLLDLAHNPAAQQRAQAAADEGDVEHLTAVFKETLRLHPVVSGVARLLMETDQIGERRLAAGSRAAISFYPLHHDEELFPQPEAFRPERFLDQNQPPGHHWAPFGGGVYRCIGASFSQAEAAAILRSVLTRYTVSPMRAEMEPQSHMPNIVIGPKFGGQVRLARRERRSKPPVAQAAFAEGGACPFSARRAGS